ncbi:MAG: HEAT repeat domain-containing protein [Planctomycetes bacterium]|nr:HEAT repeat domain-containing protein [Planctomycetota bacterium]
MRLLPACCGCLVLGLLLGLAGLGYPAAPEAGPGSNLASRGPLTTREEQSTFHLPPGFRIELVACEPEVVDPVAMAFDEDGRLFVAEMPGYPNGGVATGPASSGKIVRLEDRDGDGRYETSTVVAGRLRFPTSVLPWKGGLLVADAPDIFYLEGSGGGHTGRRRTFYTGFGLDNIQQLVNGLQWGLDNWVYAGAGNNGGTIRSVEKPKVPPVTLHGQGIRFHPEEAGSLEPTSGGGQFGLAANDWEHWFTATNNQHLRHIVLPDHYLRRNPLLSVPAVTLDIPDHGAACKVYRISPFESWRVERTRRRQGGPDARRFPATELVPGGYITSACSPVVYSADLFPPPYRGNTFVCDPANNLVHRDVLTEVGATYSARRGETESEFLASSDTWFRPVNLTVGPDGALYVLDFYREVIETPLSLPEDIQRRLNLQSRGRGRIWRVLPEGSSRPSKPELGKAGTGELVRHLADTNAWWRLTAQRLLVERQDPAAVRPLEELARTAPQPQGRAHALWTLHGLKALPDALIEKALQDAHPGVREQALRLAEDRLAAAASLRAAVVSLVEDSSPRVRFQLALTLGEVHTPETLTALARIVHRDGGDPWIQTAVLTSAGHHAPGLLAALVHDPEFRRSLQAPQLQFLTRLAAVVGAGAGEEDLARTLNLLTEGQAENDDWRAAVLEGLGQGMRDRQRPLNQLWEKPPVALQKTIPKVIPIFRRAAAVAGDEKRPLAERVAAVRLLGYGPFQVEGLSWPDLLAPTSPGDLQRAAVRALSLQDRPEAAQLLLSAWSGYSPAVRREVVEALFARPERLRLLLDAIEHQKVLPAQLEPFRVEQLRRHPDEAIRRRARALLADWSAPDRRRVVEEYRPALDLPADAGRGRTLFQKNCATCHRLGQEGVEVGPDLLSALPTKTREGLLLDILDPNREVDPRYVTYLVTTQSGRVFTGIIAAETSSSLTLRRAERAEDTILRSQIEEVRATNQSLMPEGLEKLLSKQDLADLIAYLQEAATGHAPPTRP